MPLLINTIEDVKQYSINLIWINDKLDPNNDKLISIFANGYKKDEPSLFFSLVEWAKANPEAIINLWHDGLSTKASTPTKIEQMLAT